MLRTLLLFVVSFAALAADDPHVTLAIGSHAPDFALPGVDGKTHKLSDYSISPLLAVVFTCNHCPTAQLYEDRIKRLASDYRSKGVELVAIQPNDPNALRVDEMVMCGVPALQFPVSLRWRNAVRCRGLRTKSHAAHFHFR
jgi:hypothetical protein